MGILYAVRYVGEDGIGMGAFCAGNGKIVGFDGTGGHYSGTYIEDGRRVRGMIALTFKEPWALVTGHVAQPGEVIEMAFDWPREFADGEPQQIFQLGRPVTVTAERIGEVP